MLSEDYNRYGALLDQCDKELNDIYHRYAQHYGLSDAAMWVLYALHGATDIVTQAEICDYWCFSRQTIHSAMKGLQQQDLIRLCPIPGNRKSKAVALTEAGKKLSEEIIAPLKLAESRVYAAFTPEENELFLALSQKRCALLSEFTRRDGAAPI